MIYTLYMIDPHQIKLPLSIPTKLLRKQIIFGINYRFYGYDTVAFERNM